MKLLSISAKNYRTLQNIEIPFSRSYCTISGKNNAGKSCIIRLFSTLFQTDGAFPWVSEDFKIDYKEDKTQWVKPNDPIEIQYVLELSRTDDSALIAFIEKIAEITVPEDTASLKLRYSMPSNEQIKSTVLINGTQVSEGSGKEIDKKIKGSNMLFLYNSTTGHERPFYYGAGRRRLFYEFVMSEEEKKALDEAGKNVERKLRRLTKQHKEGLNTILGRLTDRFDVEFSPPEKFGTRHMPIGINLKDKNVEVPLDDWGSGTKNRTQILMSILQANRIKTTDSQVDKITPVVVVEEPESFLHPSAQSEFGRILRALSEEFGIQIIVTTHSPYMLNRENPRANVLLCRQVRRRKAYETNVVDTTGENWMAPFAEHLGIPPNEFSNWRPVFSSYKSKVLLVEGTTDKEYFEYLYADTLQMEGLSKEIEVVPYGGKDTLKNTLLVQFVLNKFDQVFVTFDHDAESEVKRGLERLSLKETNDFTSLGLHQKGKDCIEGLLPPRVLSTVMARETDLVMKLSSSDSKARKEAKNALKKEYLKEFKAHKDYTKVELQHLAKAVKIINKKFQGTGN